MPTVAILPVKRFDRAKQRLRRSLTAAAVHELAETMVGDVLKALAATPSIDEVVVVTGEPAALRLAGTHGAIVLDDDARGHNAAALRGIAHALQRSVDRVLLVPGDCPLLDPDELEELLERAPRPPSALIVPDRHGTGTNALVLTPPDALEPSFGPGSCQRHAENASAAGIAHQLVELTPLALAVDTPEDLAALARTRC